eukprot:6183241-Pleurochrysis_carterae.AAC.1
MQSVTGRGANAAERLQMLCVRARFPRNTASSPPSPCFSLSEPRCHADVAEVANETDTQTLKN